MAEENGKDVPTGSDGVELVPAKNGGYLRPGGLKGNAGGGRPPNEIREAVREFGWEALQDVYDDWKNARKEVPTRDELEAMAPEDLVDLILEIRSYTEVPWPSRRQMLNTLLDFGIGKKHVHTGGDEAEDAPIGVVLMPGIQREGTCPHCGEPL